MSTDSRAVGSSSSDAGLQLRLVRGAPELLEQALLDQIAAARKRDPLDPIDVLVGGVLLRPYLQRRIAESGMGMLNVRFTTLGELGIRLGEKQLIDAGRRPLSAMASRGFAAEVARGTKGYFGPVAHTPGFGEATRRLIRELRQEDAALETLERHAGAAAESQSKADGLVDIYRRYLADRRDRYDGEDALAVADATLFDGTQLLVYGVWRLGALGRRLIERLAARVPVTVFRPPTRRQTARTRSCACGLGHRPERRRHSTRLSRQKPRSRTSNRRCSHRPTP